MRIGYQTTHTLTIKEGFTEEIATRLDKLLEERDCYYVFEERDIDTYEPADGYKWYEHKQDMMSISSQLGDDVLLLLEGEGESNGDVWKEYYRGGKFARYIPRVVWEEFKEDDLR